MGAGLALGRRWAGAGPLTAARRPPRHLLCRRMRASHPTARLPLPLTRLFFFVPPIFLILLPLTSPHCQFNDDQLKWGRLDFIKLADLEQVQAFVQTGYAYAERTDAGSEWLGAAGRGGAGSR